MTDAAGLHVIADDLGGRQGPEPGFATSEEYVAWRESGPPSWLEQTEDDGQIERETLAFLKPYSDFADFLLERDRDRPTGAAESSA